MNIRNAAPGDAERLLEIYSYYVEQTAVSYECETPSLDEFRNRILETQKNYPYLVAENNGGSSATLTRGRSRRARATGFPAK